VTSANADVIPAKAGIHATQTDASRHRRHRRRRCLWRQAMRSWIALSGLSAAWGCLRQARRATGYSRRIPIWKPATIEEALKYAAFLAEDETIEHAK